MGTRYRRAHQAGDAPALSLYRSLTPSGANTPTASAAGRRPRNTPPKRIACIPPILTTPRSPGAQRSASSSSSKWKRSNPLGAPSRRARGRGLLGRILASRSNARPRAGAPQPRAKRTNDYGKPVAPRAKPTSAPSGKPDKRNTPSGRPSASSDRPKRRPNSIACSKPCAATRRTWRNSRPRRGASWTANGAAPSAAANRTSSARAPATSYNVYPVGRRLGEVMLHYGRF